MSNYRILIPYFRKNLPRLIIGISSLLLVDLLQLLIPRVIKRAVDDLTSLQATGARLLEYASVVMVLALGIALFRFIWRRFLLGHSRIIEEALRNRLFSHLQSLPFSYFDRTSTGELMAHATNDIQAVQLASGMGLVAVTDTLVLGTAAVGFMLYINPTLTLIALLPMPFIALFTKIFSRIFHERFQRVQASFARLTEQARENLAGIRAVKAYTQENSEIARFDRFGRDYVAENLSMIRISGLFSPMSLFFSNLSMALLLLIGGKLTILRTISIGDFVAFNSYLLLLTWPMMALGWMVNLFQRGAASLGRIQKILDIRPEAVESKDAAQPMTVQGGIECRNLSFTYPDSATPALRNIDLRVVPGQLVGLVGRTGAGKSTLLKLIPRFYRLDKGQLYVDEVEIHDISLGSLRGAIAAVPQDPFIFADTVRNNISFGKPGADNKEIMQAAEAVQLMDEILSLPQQFDTLLGERGVTLSGGQKQRLTLARALLLDRPILILDDCLSSVDVDTELAILDNLKNYIRGKTTFIVSHRLEMMRLVDVIYVFDAGRLCEKGSHQQLVSSTGLYSKLYRRQQLLHELQN
ncbi:MAG: ABC transporter ATP-binding protein [Deltaproteobacteria bacterium]|nr:ABC transporter ATP-binding protein [Deltaproteobacteria bacterium]